MSVAMILAYPFSGMISCKQMLFYLNVPSNYELCYLWWNFLSPASVHLPPYPCASVLHHKWCIHVCVEVELFCWKGGGEKVLCLESEGNMSACKCRNKTPLISWTQAFSAFKHQKLDTTFFISIALQPQVPVRIQHHFATCCYYCHSRDSPCCWYHTKLF